MFSRRLADLSSTSILDSLFRSLNGLTNQVPIPDIKISPLPEIPVDLWRRICLLACLPGSSVSDLSAYDLIEAIGAEQHPPFLLRPRQILILVKAILLEAKIIIFGKHASRVSALVLFMVSLFTGLESLGVATKSCEKPTPVLGEELESHYGLLAGAPLLVWHADCLLFPYASLKIIPQLKKCSGFLIGATNRLFISSTTLESDILVTLEDDDAKSSRLEIRKKPPSMIQALAFSSMENRFTRIWSKKKILDEEDSSELSDEEEVYERHQAAKPVDLDVDPMKWLKRLHSAATENHSGSSAPKTSWRRAVHLPRGFNADKNLVCISRNIQLMTGSAEAVRLNISTYLEILLRLTAFATGSKRSGKQFKTAVDSKALGLPNFSTFFLHNWAETYNFKIWLANHQAPVGWQSGQKKFSK